MAVTYKDLINAAGYVNVSAVMQMAHARSRRDADSRSYLSYSKRLAQHLRDVWMTARAMSADKLDNGPTLAGMHPAIIAHVSRGGIQAEA